MSEILKEIILVAVGAISLYAIQKIGIVRRVLWKGIRRICSFLNCLRRFLLARKATRIQARAHFISRRQSISLAALEITLFRWYDKRIELLPFVQYVYENHKNERVKAKAYELLWVEKSARALQMGDIVDVNNGNCLHALHIRYDDDCVRVLWNATPNATSGNAYSYEAVFRVTRRGWCTNDDCRYCNMTPTLSREIGDWWWQKEEAERESKRLKRGGTNFSVRCTEDAERALDGLDDWEPVKVFYGRAMNAPENHDGQPAISASSVKNLKLLAEDGWEFQILRCEDYERLPRVIMFEWSPPRNS